MRAVKYKYAIALNLSITDNEDSYIRDAIEQAKAVSEELEIQVCLTNPFSGKSDTFYGNKETEKIFQALK